MHCNLDGVGWGGVGWGGGVVGNLPKCPQRREFIELIGFTRLSGAQVPASEDDNQISLVRSVLPRRQSPSPPQDQRRVFLNHNQRPFQDANVYNRGNGRGRGTTNRGMDEAAPHPRQ